jgi:ArsR family transcriptional regulator, lead/cadmium/zinc/bismuth-responsive transcriptional repressor
VCWHSWRVHLLSAERSGHRVIDAERVCEAIAAISGPLAAIQARAKTFALLGDPTRLTLLTCIKAAGPISVSDLSAATGLNDTTVSQTLPNRGHPGVAVGAARSAGALTSSDI